MASSNDTDAGTGLKCSSFAPSGVLWKRYQVYWTHMYRESHVNYVRLVQVAASGVPHARGITFFSKCRLGVNVLCRWLSSQALRTRTLQRRLRVRMLVRFRQE